MKTAFDTPRAEEFVALLWDRLPARTVEHVLSVATLCSTVAERCGIGTGSPTEAALLHDLFKATPAGELLHLAESYGLVVSPTQRERPKLLHGHVAAEFARQKLAVEDDELLEAVAWHTTGKPGLRTVGLVLYFADFSEPLRPYPEAAEARHAFEQDGLLHAVYLIAGHKLRHARLKPPVDPNTEAFRSWLDGQLEGCGG